MLEARQIPPAEKALAGQRLFEAACRITLGTRHQFPDAYDIRCREILRERLDLQRRMEGPMTVDDVALRRPWGRAYSVHARGRFFKQATSRTGAGGMAPWR